MKNNSIYINRAFVEQARKVAELLGIKASLKRDEINMRNFTSDLRKKVNESSNPSKSI